jgi:hypothetical protein
VRRGVARVVLGGECGSVIVGGDADAFLE